MACNNDEVWNPEKAEIRITILPPWWLSNGMLVVYSILIVLAIALGYALLLQRTNRRHRNKIAALHHENERKLFDAKIGFFTHITHEIRTPVTLILAASHPDIYDTTSEVRGSEISTTLTGLTPQTRYYVRAFVTLYNEKPRYSEETSFTTPAETLSDELAAYEAPTYVDDYTSFSAWSNRYDWSTGRPGGAARSR